MDLGLKGKIIIVTGGSKGIGSGIVSVLLEEGAIPIIVGRDKKTIISAVNKYKEITDVSIGIHHWEMTWMKGNLFNRIKNKLKVFLKQ